MNNFEKFLIDYDKISKKGKCKTCLKVVECSREEVAAHIRTSCPDAPAEIKKFFAITKHPKCHTVDAFLDEPMEDNASKDQIDAAVARFYLRTGITSRIADSQAWKTLITLLNPAYARQMPSSETLSGTLLDQQFNKTTKQIDDALRPTKEPISFSNGFRSKCNLCLKALNERERENIITGEIKKKIFEIFSSNVKY